MRVSLSSERSELAPGEEVALRVTVVNDGPEPVLPVVTVSGVAADDVVAVEPPEELGPGTSGNLGVRVRIPPDTPPGPQRLGVSVRDGNGLQPATWATTDLTVGDLPPVTVELHPSVVRGRRVGRLDAILRHHGTRPTTVWLHGAGDDVDIRFRADEVDLDVDDAVRVPTRIRRRRRAWFREVRHGVLIDVRGSGSPVSVTTTFTQTPLLPPWAMRLLALVTVLAVWAFAVVVVNDRLDDRATLDPAAAESPTPAASDPSAEPTAPPPATDGPDGDEPDLPVAASVVVQGTVEGPRVPAGTQVVLERVSFGDEGTTSGASTKLAALTPVVLPVGTVIERIETSTDERGRFRFSGGLTLPAFYRVSALRTGFEVASAVVETSEDRSEHDLSMTLRPAPAAMSGRAADADGVPLGGADVTVTNGELVYRTTTDTEGGTWSLQGLASPATYQVSVAKRGYATATLLRSLEGGQQLSGVDATLPSDLGTLHGEVSYRGAGVGAITVQLTGDELERTTTTLTDEGLEGWFDFPALPFGTYQLTFSAPGWLTQTAEVVVDRGDVELLVRDLLPSTAVLQGVVEQEVAPGTCEYPHPDRPEERENAELSTCGGVGVTVVGPSGTLRTTTATGTGSFSVSGVPPGEYTVAFERSGYVPAYLAVTTFAGDVLTLPGDATPTDVDQLAPQATSGERIQLRLLPLADVGVGEIQAVLRRSDAPEAVFELPAGSVVSVDGHPDATVEHLAEGAVRITGLPPGAHTVRIDAPGFDVREAVVRVGFGDVADAGIVVLTPLATLALRVTDVQDFPVVGAEVFVTDESGSGRLSATTDPGVRPCTVRRDVAGRWRLGSAGTGDALDGVCAIVTTEGEATFRQTLGTGSYRIITPTNEVDVAASAGTLEEREIRAATVPLDHQQLERLVEVRSGETSRIDLRARRYAVIEGRIRETVGAGFADADQDTFVFDPGLPTEIDGLAAFPETETFTDPNDQLVLPLGIELIMHEAGDVTTPPEGLRPRLSYGPADGLPEGVYRINRVLPNEVSVDREYELSFFAASGRRYQYRESAALTGVAFGETRIANAVLTPSPVGLDIQVSRLRANGEEIAVPGATVTVSGTTELVFENGGLFPIIETVTVVTDAFGHAQAVDDEGEPVFYLEDEPLEFIVTKFGYETLETQEQLVGGEPVELFMTPLPRDVRGSVQIVPIAGSDTPTLEGLTLVLDTVGANPAIPITSGLSSSVSLDRLQFEFVDVPPDTYRLQATSDDVFAFESGDLVLDPGSPSVAVTFGPSGAGDGSPFLVDRKVTLNVDLTEVFPAGGSVLPVENATVQLYLDGNLHATQTTDSSGRATFADLRGGPGRSYHVDVDETGYRTAVAFTDPFELTQVETTIGRELVRYGSITANLRSWTSDDDATQPLSDATVTLVDLAGDDVPGVSTKISQPNGNVEFTASDEIPAGDYQLRIVADDHDDTLVAVTVVDATETDLGQVEVPLARASISGAVSASVGGTPLAYVKVTARNANDPDTVYASTVVGPGDSSYSLAGLPPRRLIVRFEEFADAGATVATSRRIHELEREPDAGEDLTGADIVLLDEHVAISGVVSGANFDDVDAPGGPLAGATVTAVCDTPLTCGSSPLERTTAGDGSYSFNVVNEGTYTLSFSRSGYTTVTGVGLAVVVRFATSGAALTFDRTLIAQPQDVSVTVTSTGTGTPALAGVTVTATYEPAASEPDPAGGSYVFSGVTDAFGAVTLTLAPGTWTVASSGADATSVLPRPHGNGETSLTFAPDPPSPVTTALDLDPYVLVSGVVNGRDFVGVAGSLLAGATATPQQIAGASPAYPVVSGAASSGTPAPTAVDGAWAVMLPPTDAATGSRTWSVHLEHTAYEGADVAVELTPASADTTVAAPAPTGVTVTDLGALDVALEAGGVVLTASPVAVPVSTVSSVGGGALSGVTVNATWVGSPPVPPSSAAYTVSVTSAATPQDLLLAPGAWTLSTTGAVGLLPGAPPHKEVTDVVVTPFGAGATVTTQTLTLVRYASMTGIVEGATHKNATPVPLDGVSVTALSPGSAIAETPSGVDGVTGRWRAWVPDPAAMQLSFTLTGFAETKLDITLADFGGLRDANYPTPVTLLATARDVEVEVVSSVGDAELEQVLVTATGPAGAPGPFSDLTDANGVAEFKDTQALAPTDYTFTVTQGPALRPPHKDLTPGVVRTVTSGGGTLKFDNSKSGHERERLTMQRYASVTGTVGVRPYAGASLVATDGVTVTAVSPPAGTVVQPPPAVTDPWTTVGASGVDGTTGRWRVWLPDPALVTLRFELSGYTTQVLDLPAQLTRDATYGSVVALLAKTRTVEVTVVSSNADAPLAGIVLTANGPDSEGGTVDATTDGNGVATYAGLAPGDWTFTTTGATGLSPPHGDLALDDGVTRTVEVGTGTVTFDQTSGAFEHVTLTEYVAVTGVVKTRLHSGDTATASDAPTVTALVAGGSTAHPDAVVPDAVGYAGTGTWRVWTEPGADVDVLLSSAGYGDETVQVRNATAQDVGDVVLTATPRDVTIKVVSSDGDAPLQNVDVDAAASGLSSPSTERTDASGLVTFTGLEPVSWTFTTSGATALDPPHEDTSAVRAVPVGTGPVTFTSSPDWIALTPYASVTGTVKTRDNAADITLVASDPDDVTAYTAGTTTAHPTAQVDTIGYAGTGTWRVWVPDGGDVDILFELADYDDVTLDVDGATGATDEGDVVMTASAVTVTLRVVSTVSDAPVVGIDVDASSSGLTSPPTDTTDASGDVTFALPPASWTFTTSSGEAATVPHEDGSAVRTVAVGDGTLTFDSSPDWLVLTRYAPITGEVRTRPHPTGTQTTAAITPTSDLTGAVIETTGGDGAWTVWIPATGSDTAAGTITFAATGYTGATETIVGGDVTGTPPALDRSATPTVLTGIARAVTVLVVSTSGANPPLENVGVTATWNDAGPAPSASPHSDTTDANGIASFTGADALAPGDWTFSWSGGAALTPPHIDTGSADRTVPPGTTALAFDDASGAEARIEIPTNSKLFGQVGEYRSGTLVLLDGVTVQADRTGERYDTVSTQLQPGGYNYALQAREGTWRITAIRDDVPLVVDDAFVIEKDGPATEPNWLDIVLPRDGGTTLTGRILDDAGTGVGGATIVASSSAGTRSGISGSDGTYQLPALDPELTWSVTYTPPAGAPGRAVTRYVAPGGTVQPIVLDQTLPSGLGAVAVTVTQGRPAAAVLVELIETGPFPTIAADGALRRSGVLDGDGSSVTTFDQLVPGGGVSVPSGRFRVVVTVDGHEPLTRDGIEVFPGATTTVSFELGPSSLLSRDVVLTLTAEGAPLVDRTVELQRDGTVVRATVAAGTNVYTLRAVAAGEWSVVVSGFEDAVMSVPEGRDSWVADVDLVPVVEDPSSPTTPEPSEGPSPSPDADPTPAAATDPSPQPSPEASTVPESSVTPTPEPSPSVQPSVSPEPDPTPEDSVDPGPAPGPTDTASASATPSASA